MCALCIFLCIYTDPEVSVFVLCLVLFTDREAIPCVYAGYFIYMCVYIYKIGASDLKGTPSSYLLSLLIPSPGFWFTLLLTSTGRICPGWFPQTHALLSPSARRNFPARLFTVFFQQLTAT